MKSLQAKHLGLCVLISFLILVSHAASATPSIDSPTTSSAEFSKFDPTNWQEVVSKAEGLRRGALFNISMPEIIETMLVGYTSDTLPNLKAATVEEVSPLKNMLKKCLKGKFIPEGLWQYVVCDKTSGLKYCNYTCVLGGRKYIVSVCLWKEFGYVHVLGLSDRITSFADTLAVKQEISPVSNGTKERILMTEEDLSGLRERQLKRGEPTFSIESPPETFFMEFVDSKCPASFRAGTVTLKNIETGQQETQEGITFCCLFK